MRLVCCTAVLFAPLLIGGCSETLPNVAYIDCLFAAAQELDDGVSDIRIIAPRVDAACAMEKLEMVRALLKAQGEDPSGDLLQAALKGADMSATIVAAVRSEGGNGEAVSPPASQ
jgi:hypothetical protein